MIHMQSKRVLTTQSTAFKQTCIYVFTIILAMCDLHIGSNHKNALHSWETDQFSSPKFNMELSQCRAGYTWAKQVVSKPIHRTFYTHALIKRCTYTLKWCTYTPKGWLNFFSQSCHWLTSTLASWVNCTWPIECLNTLQLYLHSIASISASIHMFNGNNEL